MTEIEDVQNEIEVKQTCFLKHNITPDIFMLDDSLGKTVDDDDYIISLVLEVYSELYTNKLNFS